MRKISILSMFLIFVACPVIAEELSEEIINTMEPMAQKAEEMSNNVAALKPEVVAEDKTESLINNDNAPQKPWWRGWQVGVGVPLMVPFTGYNGFVGYANKKSTSWWGRRVGVRLDFQIPSELSATGTMRGNGDGYDMDLNAKLLFVNQNFENITTFEGMNIDIDNQSYSLNLDGTKAKVALKNQNIGALVDIYPFGDTWFLGGIRLSGGYYIGKMEFSLAADIPNDLPDNNGFVYSANPETNIAAKFTGGAKASGRVNWNYSGPYAGLGFDLGVYGGFKFYMDAGVVFTKAPRMHDNDIYIPERFNACIANGTTCGASEMVSIDIRDPNGSRDALIARMITSLTTDPWFGGKDYTSVTGTIPVDPADVLFGISGWLTGGGPKPAWVDSVTGLYPGDNPIKDIIDQIEGDNFDLSGLTQDYLKARADIVDDANDAMKDLKFVPMVRLGMMYRF